MLRVAQKEESFPGSNWFSEYFGGFHPIPERRCKLRFKASAVAMASLLRQGDMRDGIPEEPGRRGRQVF
jgi:hypothetical protein